MRLTWRDGSATLFVGLGALVYALWATGVVATGGSGPKVVGGIILGLGLAASVTAVVYGVGAGLLQASKIYLAIASVVGVVALVAGISVLLNASEPMLDVLMTTTLVLWLISTVRHVMIADEHGGASEPSTSQPSRIEPLDKAA
jgi:hypothetical protein